MEFYIRGAWRTFREQPERTREESEATQRPDSIGRMTSKMESLVKNVTDDAGPSFPRSRLMLISTDKFLELKTFYGALADWPAVFEDENKCAFAYGDKQILVVLNSRKTRDAEHIYSPKVSGLCTIAIAQIGVLSVPDHLSEVP